MGAKSFREAESKFDVDADFVLPAFEGLPGVESVTGPAVVDLEAVYYDSPDLRLSRRGVTLRRRTGGHDEGWHLKLPVSVGERDEIQLPLSSGGSGSGEYEPVPSEFADLVLAYLRRANPVPVVRLRTRRTAYRLRDAAGADLVEIVDDEVAAELLDGSGAGSSWREIETELIDGDRKPLVVAGDALIIAGATPSSSGSKLARALGTSLDRARAAAAIGRPGPALGPGTPAGDVVRAYLAKNFDALLAADPRVRLDEPDAVHKMRVASRRLRSTFRTFEPLFDGYRARLLDGELRDLAAALSGARDNEVLLEHFDAEIAALPRKLVRGPVKRAVHSRLRTETVKTRAQTLASLRDDRYLRLLDQLEEMITGEPGAVPDGAGAPAVSSAAKPGGKTPTAASPTAASPTAASPATATPTTVAPAMTTPSAASKKAKRVLPGLIRKVDRKLARRVTLISTSDPGPVRDEALHDARKQAKRLRYAAEAVAPAFGSDATTLASLATTVQEVLGDRQDAAIARELLTAWGTEAQTAGAREAFTLGVLLGRADGRARLAEREFEDVWREASRERYRRWLRA